MQLAGNCQAPPTTHDQMNPSENPYASPESDLTPPVENVSAAPDAVQIRRKYVNHDAEIKALSGLYTITGGSITIGFGFLLLFGLGYSSIEYCLMISCCIVGSFSLWVGILPAQP